MVLFHEDQMSVEDGTGPGHPLMFVVGPDEDEDAILFPREVLYLAEALDEWLKERGLR
jgi:hypothetical protein